MKSHQSINRAGFIKEGNDSRVGTSVMTVSYQPSASIAKRAHRSGFAGDVAVPFHPKNNHTMQIKTPVGGKRLGAGRKLGTKNHSRSTSPITAAKILRTAGEVSLWMELLTCSKPNIRLQSLMYLTDRRDGRPYMAPNPALMPKAVDPRLTAAVTALLPNGGVAVAVPTKQFQALLEMPQDEAPGHVLEAATELDASDYAQRFADAPQGQPSTREVPPA